MQLRKKAAKWVSKTQRTLTAEKASPTEAEHSEPLNTSGKMTK